MRPSSAAAVAALPMLASFVQAQASNSSSKRGLVYVPSESDSKQQKDDKIFTNPDTDLTWYYNYGATPTSELESSDLEFVPMLWGVSDGQQSFYDTVKSLVDDGMDITYVLGFNEPDGCANGGSCIDAETAATVWQQEIEPLKQMGIKLGAPAVTGSPMGFVWLQNWFTQCAGKCTPDFIPIHWYGNFEGLASHVGQVNATYPNMTMWCTEYAYNNATLEESEQFVNNSLGFFDSLDYMTHYSYFGSFRSDVSNVGPNAAMLTQNGDLTDIGAYYLGEPQLAVGNVPEGSAGQIARFAGWTAVVAASTIWILS